MDYIKHDMGNYNLYLIKTKKFKTISVSINLRRENTKEAEVYCTLLKRLLPLATAKYPDIDKLYRASMDIYNPSVNFNSIVSGKDRWFSLESSFASEKYTEKEMNKKSLEFILDYLWEPYIVNDSFDEKLFDICKHEIIEDLKSIKNDPDRYSSERAWEEMEILPFDEMGIKETIEFTEAVTANELYNYYQSMFKEDALDIFIAGNFNDNKMIKIVKDLVTGDFKPSYKNRLINLEKPEEVKQITEKTNNKQSKLVMGLKHVDLTEYERKYVWVAYNSILGGSWNSKLNKVVREEHSLCYYVYSSRKMPFGVSFIHSGINSKDVDKAVKLIQEEIKKIAKGKISDEELQVVKDTYDNALTNIEDNQFAILDNIVSCVFSDTDSIEDRRRIMNGVTKEEVAIVGQKVCLDIIYLLEGRQAK